MCSPASRDLEWQEAWWEPTLRGVLLSHQALECHRSIEKMTHHRDEMLKKFNFDISKKEKFNRMLLSLFLSPKFSHNVVPYQPATG